MGNVGDALDVVLVEDEAAEEVLGVFEGDHAGLRPVAAVVVDGASHLVGVESTVGSVFEGVHGDACEGREAARLSEVDVGVPTDDDRVAAAHCERMATMLPWVPLVTRTASSLPSRSAAIASSRFTVGSSPSSASPSSASAIATRISGLGRVLVSLRRSTILMVFPCGYTFPLRLGLGAINAHNTAIIKAEGNVSPKKKRLVRAPKTRKPRRKQSWRDAGGDWDDLSYDRQERVASPAERERRRQVVQESERAWLGTPQEEYRSDDDATGLLGVVTSVHGSLYMVELSGEPVECHIRESLKDQETGFVNPVAVGDRVVVTEDGAGGFAIEELLERDSILTRPSSFKGYLRQIVAANVDQLLIVTSWSEPAFWPELVDRYLVTADVHELDPGHLRHEGGSHRGHGGVRDGSRAVPRSRLHRCRDLH